MLLSAAPNGDPSDPVMKLMIPAGVDRSIPPSPSQASISPNSAVAPGVASPCSAVGTPDISCDSMDCTPALLVVAWVRVSASALVVGAGSANGVSVDAAADEPA